VSLLEAVVRQRATVVIMDITGLAGIDTAIAHHFLQTVSAARLLGACVILSGVSAHNAQTLVKLGVELDALTTVNSLQAGLLRALQLTGHRIVKDPR
jgi:rsbT co-antagonist protein RsbR